MKNVVSFLILAAAWGHAALPAAATSAALPFDGFVSAVSADSAAVRLEVRNMALVAPRVVSGTQSLVSLNGFTAIAWDTTALANGWQEVSERNERVQIPVSLSGDRSSATYSTRRSRAERSSSW